jgi:flagellar biosynthetic protein FliO
MQDPTSGPRHAPFSAAPYRAAPFRAAPFRAAAQLKNTALFLRGSALFQKLPAWAWGLAFLALLGLSSLVAGGGQTSGTGLSASEPPNLLALGISVLFKLGLVIVLIYASMIFLRRWRVPFPARPDRQISVLETTRLSPRQSIHLVRVKDQLLLIGATDQGLSLLTEFDAPAGEDLLAPVGPASFERRLADRLPKSGGSGKAPLPLKTSEVSALQQAQEAP